MTTTDVLEATLAVAITVFVILVLFSVATMRWRKYRGQGWRKYGPRLVRYLGIRFGIAIGIAFAFGILVTAALTLNMHRPPADTNPLVRVHGAEGPATVHLSLNQCGDPLEGFISFKPAGTGKLRASIYTDQQGLQKIPMNDRGRGRFQLEDLTAKRSILSCYLQLPVITGDTGASEVQLRLGDDQEVDSEASVPAPDGYHNGAWEWLCEGGGNCPTLATFGASVESGTQQVIVMVLAAVFGSILAVMLAELLLEPVRRRLSRIDEEAEDQGRD